MSKIISLKDSADGVIVDGLVPAKCIVGYYKVRIKVKGSKLIDSQCSCGSTLCPHAVKLYLFYMAHLRNTKDIQKK
ncbi:hypothetical protein DFR86_01905 [Acidianus sulfidivorans JP7]|uniref:SWIM-type domain-containing protein n=1 Tax=Acidianus sulfidivorans JP7 TaxID=619593 RepID=A0A2U9IK45_9CREN|nr:hypothetical protein [Acidianus sulfidivorans]AWR96422.1 hypothetical protein DFR86_01905 [Acidianus sulfidivorans JP7]